MNHIEALERLQKLRESGAISDAEFEREKEQLLQLPAAAAPRAQSWLWIAGGAAAILLLAVVAILLLRRESGADANDSKSANLAAAPASDSNVVAPAPVETGIRARPQAEQLTAAFRTAFGRDRRATRRVDGANITYTPGGLRWIGERAVLASPGRSDQNCHGCSGTVAIHYLQADGDGFRVAGEWLNGISGGTWGEAPGWEFSTLLSDQPLIEAGGGGTWQGVLCSGIAYYELGSNGPREIVRMIMGMDNAGSMMAEDGTGASSFEGRIRNVVKGRSFDVVYTGTEHFTEHYVMRAGRYVLASGETRATC